MRNSGRFVSPCHIWCGSLEYSALRSQAVKPLTKCFPHFWLILTRQLQVSGMGATRIIALVTSLLLFGIHLHRFQDKYIDFGLNITLASKQVIRAGIEAVNRSRRELVCSAIFTPSPKSTFRRLLLVFLLLCGNTESNPCPQFKYSYGKCSKLVKWNQNGIQCNRRAIWFQKLVGTIEKDYVSPFAP